MKPLTDEWVQKAEADYAHIVLAHDAKSQGFDVICFLSQQCVEKYLKAVLQERGVAFPKSHDLLTLLSLFTPPNAELNNLSEQLDQLTAWAVDVRYPGFFASAEHAELAIAAAESVRSICRKILNLPN